MFKSALVFSILLYLLVLSFDSRGQLGQRKSGNPIVYGNLSVPKIAGQKLFSKKKCIDCHALSKSSNRKLLPIVNRREYKWFQKHVEEESAVVLEVSKSKRKQKRALIAEATALSSFLYKCAPEERQQMEDMPQRIFDGAYLIYQNNCSNCHRIADYGGDIGPNLTQIGRRRDDREWLSKYLKNPQEFAPESPMPTFDHLPEKELELIVSYLLGLNN